MPDEHFQLDGACFVWDIRKANANILAHAGVTFEQASRVFFDPMLQVVVASRNNQQRDKVIGYAATHKLLAVVHLIIENECIRIISAWPASPE